MSTALCTSQSSHACVFVRVRAFSCVFACSYAPWCGHCKSLAPVWAEAAKRAKKLSPPIPIAKVDADAHKDLGSRFDVTGFPTIKLFRGGAASEYDGARDADGILASLKKAANYKPPTQLTDAASAKQLAEASSCLLVGFFRTPVAASAAYKTYISAAAEVADCTVAWSAAPAGKIDPAAEALELPASETPGLLLISKGMLRTKRANMKLPRNKADFTTDSITEWVEANK